MTERRVETCSIGEQRDSDLNMHVEAADWDRPPDACKTISVSGECGCKHGVRGERDAQRNDDFGQWRVFKVCREL